MPVRIFTYLIGGGSSSRESMHNIACSNKGNTINHKLIQMMSSNNIIKTFGRNQCVIQIKTLYLLHLFDIFPRLLCANKFN